MGNSYETFSYPLGSRPRPYITHTFDPCRLGHEGHEIVALLAQTRLTENAKNGIRSMIGDASLASIANWADEVRPERDETYNWHFVDIPKGGGRERGCRHGVRLTAVRAASLVAGVVVPMPLWPWCPIPTETAPSPPEDVEPAVVMVGYQPRRLLRRLSDGRDVGSGGPQRNVVGRTAPVTPVAEGHQPRMRAIRSELWRQKGSKPCPPRQHEGRGRQSPQGCRVPGLQCIRHTEQPPCLLPLLSDLYSEPARFARAE